MLRALLAHPLTHGKDVDDPSTTALRRRIVREKPFLRQLYEEWYGSIAARLPAGGAPVLELGSGAGFFSERVPGVITSEVFACPGIRVVSNGCRLPFAPESLRAIVMTDVLHHVPDPADFLAEAVRTLVPGGRIVMIEPWLTTWSRRVYARHPEPLRPDAADWGFPATGPLSGANIAIPWMIFERDRPAFEARFPELAIREIAPFMPFAYLVSGGVSLRNLAPGWSYRLCRGVERALAPWNDRLAMFALIALERLPAEGTRHERPHQATVASRADAAATGGSNPKSRRAGSSE
jgi:SAM-dependent methyltransferase